MDVFEVVDSLHSKPEVVRRLADFPKDIWGDRFDSFTGDYQVFLDMHGAEMELLKKEVRTMLTTSCPAGEKLKLIDAVERLGISYHFEDDVETQLREIFNLQTNVEEDPSFRDMFTVALHFRLFRQHGFNISCGVFHQFLDENGKFKENLSTDTRGLLSLYEATQLRTHKDDILEEALAFTTLHLERGLLHASPSLANQVKYALMHPLHKCVPRIAARRYISFCEEEEFKDPSLLRLAKLDFNLLQLLYKKELLEIIRWCNESEILSKLPYSRARAVESYFYALGIFYEPHYSFGRVISAKTTVLVTVIDDTYDSYSTLDELQIFTDVIERWNAKEIDRLPSFMQISYMALLDLCEGVEEELTNRGRLHAFNKYKEEWKEYARCSYTQAQWFLRRELPTFPEYLKNGLTTGLAYLLIPTALLAVDSATKDLYDNWLSTYPKILVASAKICRLTNDIRSHEREKQIGGTGIECYMKHYNVSEEEAKKKFEEITEDAWKDVNEECLQPTAMSREVVNRFFNLARIVYVFYKHGEDGFTNPQTVIEAYEVELLLDPVV